MIRALLATGHKGSIPFNLCAKSSALVVMCLGFAGCGTFHDTVRIPGAEINFDRFVSTGHAAALVRMTSRTIDMFEGEFHVNVPHTSILYKGSHFIWCGTLKPALGCYVSKDKRIVIAAFGPDVGRTLWHELLHRIGYNHRTEAQKMIFNRMVKRYDEE